MFVRGLVVNQTYSTVTEWFSNGVKPISYIVKEIDLLKIIQQLKHKY